MKKTLDFCPTLYYNSQCVGQDSICGGVAQLARANGSYPLGRWFEPTRRYHFGPLVKRLRHRPFTAVTRVQISYGSPYGSIAQLGEHLPYKQRVIGSSPIVPTKTKKPSIADGFFVLVHNKEFNLYFLVRQMLFRLSGRSWEFAGCPLPVEDEGHPVKTQ